MESRENVNLNQQYSSAAELNRKIWSLSGPMMLSNISLPLLGLVDTAVMGHLDSAVYLAAVSVGAMILHFIFWGFGFLRMATVGLAAQAFGAGDGTELRQVLARAGLFAILIALLLIVMQSIIIQLSLFLVGPEPDVAALVRDYFDVRIWSAPATLLTYVLLGWFLGVQQARQVLLVMVFVNVLNIVLDLVFVAGFGMKVQGVAWATLLSEYSGMLLAFFLLRQQLRRIAGQFIRASILQLAQFKKLLSLNSDIFIRTIALLFVFAFFTTQSVRSGDLVMAANAVLLQFLTFMAYVLDAYAHAAEALVGEAVGRANRQRLTQAVNACLRWSLGSALVFMLVYLLAGDFVVALLTDIADVRSYASQFLLWLACMPLIAVWSYLYDGVFIGATWSREMRNVMLMAMGLVFLPVWYLSRDMGNHGLWLSMMMFMAVRGGLMAYFYRRKRGQLLRVALGAA